MDDGGHLGTVASSKPFPKSGQPLRQVERQSGYTGGGARRGRVTAVFGIDIICVVWPEVDIRTSSSITSGSSANPGTHFRLVGQ